MAASSQITQLESRLLEKRFDILGKKKASRSIETGVFNQEPYLSEPFCKHLVKKKLSDTDHTISREAFCKSVVDWQYEPVHDKLTCLFGLIKSGDSVSQQILWKVLSQTIPGYTEQEYKVMACSMIEMMKSTTGTSDGKLSLDDFTTWIDTHIEKDKLQNTLDFKINHN